MSESTEMYLATILQLREAAHQPLSLSDLADALSITSISANEMCRKLEAAGLLIYRPYKGVILTPAGERKGRQVLRNRGLWTVFLTEYLEMAPQLAEAAACQLEHATSDAVSAHLDAFLDSPRTTSSGVAIPPPMGEDPGPLTLPLKTLSTNQKGCVVAVRGDGPTRDFLAAQGLKPGAMLTVLAVAESGERLLALEEDRRLALGADLVPYIDVTPVDALSQPPLPGLSSGAVVPEWLKRAHPTIDQTRQIRLSELQKGQVGTIVRVGVRGALRQRLLDMGVIPGKQIRLKRTAPLEYTVNGVSLSLRDQDAAQIWVEVAV